MDSSDTAHVQLFMAQITPPFGYRLACARRALQEPAVKHFRETRGETAEHELGGHGYEEHQGRGVNDERPEGLRGLTPNWARDASRCQPPAP